MSTTSETLRYATHDGVELLGDLHRPAGDGPFPAVLAIPGGGWRRGSRTALAAWGRHLAAAGFAVFAIDHRRTTAGPAYPQAPQDVLAALRFLSGEAPRLGVDRGRLAILGASAGAHLGALVALAGDKPFLADAYPDDPHAGERPAAKAFVGVYGPYDLFSHWQADTWRAASVQEDPTSRLMGFSPYADRDLYAHASPLHHVRYDTAALKVMLAWGEEDTEILPAQSRAFHRALVQAGFAVRTLPVPGAGHFWFSEDAPDDPAGFSARVAPALVRFLRQSLPEVSP